MTLPNDTLAIIQLRRHGAAFRWLWDHHDTVAGILTEKGNNPRTPVWAYLTDMARGEGSVGFSRAALRQAWPKVEAIWRQSNSGLRAARISEVRSTSQTTPHLQEHFPVTPAGDDKSVFFASEDTGFELPDITGRKI